MLVANLGGEMQPCESHTVSSARPVVELARVRMPASTPRISRCIAAPIVAWNCRSSRSRILFQTPPDVRMAKAVGTLKEGGVSVFDNVSMVRPRSMTRLLDVHVGDFDGAFPSDRHPFIC